MELCNFTYSLLKRRLLSLAVLGLICLTGAGPALAQAGGFIFKLRDQQTGLNVAGAKVFVYDEADKNASPLAIYERGNMNVSLEDGYYRFVIKAPGYDDLETYFKSEAGQTLEVKAMLDPRSPSSEMYRRLSEKGNASASRSANESVIEGYVGDKETGEPLQGVRVAVGPRQGVTNAQGFFQIRMPAPEQSAKAINDPELMPAQATLVITKEGYRQHEVQDFFLMPDTQSFKIALEKGSAEGRVAPSTEKYQHGMFAEKHEDEEPVKDFGFRNPFMSQQASANTAPPMPTSIRIGTGCNTSYCTCTGVIVLNFESYVEAGLDDEWISGWNANSLRAGAIAYRTYAARHTIYPYASNYDLTSNTCRQAYGSASYAATINAAQYTSGQVLVKGGTFAFSEYSAENNAKACADGYAGDNNVYACFSDAVCAGYNPNGHGRGMCQWGSARWANSGYSHTWILDHYYNRNGIYRATGGSSGGGTNIATSASVYSHSSDYGAGYTAWQAIDGRLDTKWVSNGVNTYQAMYLNLNGYFNINKFVIKHAGANGEWSAMNTEHYKIYYWSGSSWVSVVDYYNTQQHNETSHNVSLSAQYVYLEILDPGVDNYTRIPEWEIYGSSGSRAELQPQPPLNNSLSSLMVYPNPAEDELNVRFGTPRQQPYSLSMVDITGREVYTESFDNADNSSSASVRVSNLKPGIYLLTVSGAEGTETIRCQVK
ncbi:T9SS type A sorting domain-containing protein [Roseivirga sp. BDSF3-8]|uniref:T9SS type A sorting domain-containing protein n=1 Tax=Roseivirga sp. BDSF3-8 TaxID=3241598 RepID=UPI003532436B